MATTHGFTGSLTALPLLIIAPEHLVTATAAAFIGGVFPDLDLYHMHRKLLHYPIYYNAICVLTIPVLITFTNTYTVLAWFFLASAGLHCFIDRFGGSKDSRPWKNDSGKAVYSHYHGKWLEPQKLIRYDGSPEDFALMLLAALPLTYLLDGPLKTASVLLVGVSLVYTIFRKKGMEIIPDRFLRTVD